MSMVNPPLRLLAAFQTLTEQAPEWLLQVPERDMWVGACLNQQHHYLLVVPDLNGRTQFNRRSAKQHRTVRGRPLPKWGRYVAGAAYLLGDTSQMMPGMSIVIVGDEPSGPRYHHALGMAFGALWHEYHATPYTATHLLDLMEQVQMQYLST